jgi:hypothetical protein
VHTFSFIPSSTQLTFHLRAEFSSSLSSVTKQLRYEEQFIPHTPVSDTAQSPDHAIPIPLEHRHDLEVWRREIREISHREGVYLGRTGTFVMNEWEVGVLPGRVLYEGEPEEREFKIREWERRPRRYKCVYTTFGKLDPWSVGLVAMHPSQETVTSKTIQKLHRTGPKFLSAIRHC